MKEARLRTLARDNNNKDNVEFEDQDLASNKDLKKVGVVVRDLKRQFRIKQRTEYRKKYGMEHIIEHEMKH